MKSRNIKARFIREASLLGRLQHPNLVTVYELGSDPEAVLFMAMELLNGSDREYLLETKPPSMVEGLEIVAQACRGLAYVHSKGFVHRDVKPANIFVTNAQAVKILDFGWARRIDEMGIVVGTPGYMSPEQTVTAAVDGRCIQSRRGFV